MTKKKETPKKYQEGFITAISVGFFILLIGIIFVITPNLFDNVMDFLGDFGLVDVPNTDIVFIGPESPRSHLAVYKAVGQFSIAIGIFQIVIMGLRFLIPSTWEKRSETLSNFVFWTGSSFLIQLFLIESTQWFVFWSTIIVIGGISLLARAAFISISRI